MTDDIITCDACPVLCRIRPGRNGACDRYANHDGALTRLDPVLRARGDETESGDVLKTGDSRASRGSRSRCQGGEGAL